MKLICSLVKLVNLNEQKNIVRLGLLTNEHEPKRAELSSVHYARELRAFRPALTGSADSKRCLFLLLLV